MTMLSMFVDKVVLDHKKNAWPTDNYNKIGDVMKEYMLPISMMEELSIVLFRINKLKRGGVKTPNEKNGKTIQNITSK